MMRNEGATLALLPPEQPIAETSAVSDDALASPARKRREDRSGWEPIDEKLRAWGRDPDQFDAGEIVPPSRPIIYAARRVADKLCELGSPAPLRVVPDGDGGIAFEFRHRDDSETVHIHYDNSVEWIQFHKCQIFYRQQLRPVSTWT
jgi:hypothetical protein